MSDDFSYRFPAVAGRQNKRSFFQTTVPFKALAAMLKLDDAFDATQRSQRLVNKKRGKAVAEYIKDNQDGFWVIPPLVGFFDGKFQFTEMTEKGFERLGVLSVPIETKIMLFDGQHRAFGIKDLMIDDEARIKLMGQSVSIMLFDNLTLEQRQQAFHDINFTQKTPAKALCIAYNGRSDFDKMVFDVFSKSQIRYLIEYEKNSCAGTSENIYSLKSLQEFAAIIVDDRFDDDTKQLLANCVEELFKTVNLTGYLASYTPPSDPAALSKHHPSKLLREDSIIGHVVTLKALAMLLKAMLIEHPTDWAKKLKPLKAKSIWNRYHDYWINRCVNPQGKMIANALASRLTYYRLKEICGLKLAPEEKAEEKAYFSALAEAA